MTTAAVAGHPSAARHHVARSALARAGGYVKVRLVDDLGLRWLQLEASAAEARALACQDPVPPGDTDRRGHADRTMAVAVGGPVLDSLLCAPATLELLRHLTGVAFLPHGRVGTYSYYREPGHHLGLHRDVRGCDVAVITCVWDTGGAGGELVLYPGAAGRPLAEVRADPSRGARPLRLQPGDSVVLLGGIVPHRVTPVGPGHTRVVAPLCYQLATTA